MGNHEIPGNHTPVGGKPSCIKVFKRKKKFQRRGDQGHRTSFRGGDPRIVSRRFYDLKGWPVKRVTENTSPQKRKGRTRGEGKIGLGPAKGRESESRDHR